MVRVIVSTTEPPLFINLSWWGFSRFDPNFMHCGLALYPIIGFLWLYCRMMEKSWCPNLRLLGTQWLTVLSCSTVEKHKYHSAAVYHVLEINQTNTSWLYQLIRSLAIQRWYTLLHWNIRPSICTLISNLPGWPDIFLGSGTLKIYNCI